MRAVTVTGATLAFLGCCLFVMHAENSPLQFESVKLSQGADAVVAEDNDDKFPKLSPAELKAVMKEGRKAVPPRLYKDPEFGPGFDKDGKKIVPAFKPLTFTRLEKNCLALKAYSYTVADAVVDAGFNEMGVVYNLLMAMVPTPDPIESGKKMNMSPKDCVKQYKGFVKATHAKFHTKDSLPLDQLSAIRHSMEGDGGLLTIVKHDGAHYITLDGKKIGLATLKALSDVKDLDALQADVYHMLNTLKGKYQAVIDTIPTAPEGYTLKGAAAHFLVDVWKGH
jgi:hypothetical protein